MRCRRLQSSAVPSRYGVLFAYARIGARSAVVGELDEDLDANLDLAAIMAPPLKPVCH